MIAAGDPVPPPSQALTWSAAVVPVAAPLVRLAYTSGLKKIPSRRAAIADMGEGT